MEVAFVAGIDAALRRTLDLRIGKWYTVEAKHGVVNMSCFEERLQRADPVVMAYDIETTKLPLKFPDAAIDQIMMISYMLSLNLGLPRSEVRPPSCGKRN